MDTFGIIQHFFTRMACQFCSTGFQPDDVHLVGEGEGFYLVSVHCHQCGQHNGDAAVGVHNHVMAHGVMTPPHYTFDDPEWTESDLTRLGEFEPIREEDVLQAHDFIQNLGPDWMKFIPEEIRESHRLPETE